MIPDTIIAVDKYCKWDEVHPRLKLNIDQHVIDCKKQIIDCLQQ